MTADPAIRDALASQFDEYEIRRELHRVPPHVTYEVAVDGTRAVCKLATGPEAAVETEARVLQHVESHTTVPVPHVLAAGREWFVAEWCDGLPDEADEDRAPDGALLRTLGETMATLHGETAGAFDGPGLLRIGDGELAVESDGTWIGAVRAFLAERRAFLERIGHADVADAVLDLLSEYPDAFAGAGGPVLCHGNLLPAHIAIRDGAATCVIDFEHALVGPPEYDFWRTAMPLSGDGGNGDNDDGGGDGDAAVEAFREGYESVRSLPDGFDRRKRLYWTVNAVSYLRALDLQGNVTGREAERRAEGFREFVRESLTMLEESLE